MCSSDLKAKDEMSWNEFWVNFIKDCFLRLVAARFFIEDEDSPEYIQANRAAYIIPLIFKETGTQICSDIYHGHITELDQDKKETTRPASGSDIAYHYFKPETGANIFFDWLEELIIYDGSDFLLDKVMPKWLSTNENGEEVEGKDEQ